MKKMTLAAALAIAFAPIVILAPAAQAGPCTAPVSDPVFCQNCLIATAPTGQQAGCSSGPAITKPGPVGSTGYADCDQYQIWTDRGTCVDQHLAGQR
jgi:hypothetical protein